MNEKLAATITVTDKVFNMGGGYTFADEVAVGMEARCEEAIKAANRGSVGVFVNTVELLWFIEAYARLRREQDG